MSGYWQDIIHKGQVVGRYWAGETPEAGKLRYTLSQWIDALTDAELDVILDYVNGDTGTTAQKRAARRAWEHWRATNTVDMNAAKNQQILTWLVNNSGGVWTAARRTELIG